MEVITIPCLYDNYAYLITGEGREDAAVIDPSESWPVMRELADRGLTLSAVLLTHHHNDHTGGLDDLLDEYAGLRVIGLRSDQMRLGPVSEALDDGGEVSVCGVNGTVIHTPGHTTGAVAYHFDTHLFTGDTLFGAGCGRLFEGTAEQMLQSLKRLHECGPETLVYFGHEYTEVNLRFAEMVEPANEAVAARLAQVRKLREEGQPTAPSSMAEESQTNPFLRSHEPAIIRYLENRYGLEDRSPAAVFAVLRELRNNFS